MQRILFASGALLASAVPALAQPSATPVPTAPAATTASTSPQPANKPLDKIGGFTLSGFLRSRVENYGWFDTPGFEDKYTFTGHQLRVAGIRSTPKLDIQIDLQQQLLTNLPNNAIAPAPQGALGLGGSYYQANGHQDGALNVKQAFVRFKGAFGTGSAARVGRFEWGDGAETTPKDATLNWLKTQRIAQRMVGTFGFSHTGRSFDGGQISLPVSGGNFTALAVRPTEGVFQLEANDNVDSTGFLYGAYTKSMSHADARVFGMAYEDGRDASKSVKADNRPLAARQADDNKIRVYTLGANYIRTSGPFDLLAWGAVQGGKWGELDHSGNAIALEAGYQPKSVVLKPWFRLGYYRASGDKNAADGKHTTFFTPLPTPRLYARFPFYNAMNNTDLFAQAILRPNPKSTFRLEAHKLDLTSSSDLWYSGGGVYQDSGFGISGRPANGNSKLANVFDISFDYTFDPQTSIGLYYGYAQGGKVIDAIYPNGHNAHLAFVELNRKF